MGSNCPLQELKTNKTKRSWRLVRRGLTVAGIAIGAFIIYSVIWSIVDMRRGPQVGVNVRPEDAPYEVPSEATDVCYVTRPAFWPNAAFEFSISEEGFRKWAKAEGYAVEDIGPEPCRMYRYKWIAEPKSDDGRAAISDGLYYQWNEEDRGLYVTYDRDKQRAYYFRHSR